MRLWIDLANSPHVPFFRALIDQFCERGHEVETTARDFAETLPMASAAGLQATAVGNHGGGDVSKKATNLMGRAWLLASWARKRRFDLAISHNSYSQILAARALKIKTVTLMDYEYQPANHLAFRLTSRLVIPESFPDKRLRRYGASPRKVRRYHGTKEDVYLARFKPDPAFQTKLSDLGVAPANILITMRPPALEALYHRFQNNLFDEALSMFLSDSNVRVVLLPRNEGQRAFYLQQPRRNLIVPSEPLDGPNLIAASDLVVSAGGTINREAAALGVPAASIYAGKWAAVDEQLRQEGRLQRIASVTDLQMVQLRKRTELTPRRSTAVINEVVNMILE